MLVQTSTDKAAACRQRKTLLGQTNTWSKNVDLSTNANEISVVERLGGLQFRRCSLVKSEFQLMELNGKFIFEIQANLKISSSVVRRVIFPSHDDRRGFICFFVEIPTGNAFLGFLLFRVRLGIFSALRIFGVSRAYLQVTSRPVNYFVIRWH